MIIENLHVNGTIYTSKKYATGFVAQTNNGYLTFTNCRSSITIDSRVNGDGTHGGFVGVCNATYILEFNGCLFDGKFLGSSTEKWAGFVGWLSTGTVRFYQSIFAPNQVRINTTESATFCRNADSNTLFRRAYYTQEMNDGTYFTGQGKQLHSITPGNYVNLSLSGSETYYSVTGITNYGGSWDEHYGLKYNNTYYAGSEETVNITLSLKSQGYIANSYVTNGGTLSSSDGYSYTLTMPNANVTISANYSPNPAHFSQSGNTYTIHTAEGWNVFCDLLAGGQTYNVTLVGRTLYKDGAWNTLCLPFSLTEEQIAASSLADADIRTLSGTNFSEGTLTLAFTPKAPAEGTVTSITAGTPYIIKWAKADGYDQADPATRDIKNPEFTSVTISNTSADVETTYMDFKGTYDRTNIYTDKKTNLYLGADDTLYYPWAEGMSSFNINAFRAYFQLKNGLTAGDPALSRFMLNFGDGEASGISLTPDLSPKGKGSIYTIDGRKVNGQHAKKGLYIHNGRKVVVK